PVGSGGVAPNTLPEPQAETLTPAPAVDQSMVASAGTGQQEALQSPAPAIDQTMASNSGVAGGTQPEQQAETLTPAPAIDQTLVASAGSMTERPEGPLPATEPLVASNAARAGGAQPEQQAETLTPAPAVDQSMVASAGTGQQEALQSPAPAIDQTDRKSVV